MLRVSLLTLILLLGFNIQVVWAANDEVTVEAEGSVNYDAHTNITTANNNVKISHENGIITADQVTYYGNDGIIKAIGSVKVSSNDGVIIEANRLDYNNLTGIAEFNEQVKLTTGEGVMITAEKLTYSNSSGLAVASGGVKIIYKNDVYQTESIEYNLKTGEGSTNSSNCTLDSSGNRDVKLIGKSMQIVNGVTKMKKAVFTRCLKPASEYFITASSIEYDEKSLKLWNPVVFIYGIPVFYLPYLSFQVDSKELPNLEPGYNSTDGYFLKYSFATPVENGHNWYFNGAYKTKDTSTYNVGLGLYKGNISNTTSLTYNIPITGESYWSVSDTIAYNMPLFYLTMDGSRIIDSSEKTQYGFNFTRKYWDSPLGRWQAGILVREITTLSGSDKYGGLYDGLRLDYNPNRYMILSFLQINPLSTYSDDGAVLESIIFSDYDYKFGSNWLYNITIPLSDAYSFGLDGTFNSTDSLWINRNYKFTRSTDCFSLSLGWDDIAKNITFDWKMSF